jgi:hypothetical protein
MAIQSMETIIHNLNLSLFRFINSTTIDLNNKYDIKYWIDNLEVYLCKTKKLNENLTIPRSYRLLGKSSNSIEMIGIIITELSHQETFIKNQGESWTHQWGSDLIGYINILFTLFLQLTDYRVEVPKWEYNNYHSWLL